MSLEGTNMAQSLEELEKRVAALERIVANLAPETPSWPENPDEWTREDLIAFLRSRGVEVSEPTPRERALAAEWDALPEEEKRAHREYMDGLKLDPPLSEIIIQNRR
jgi:hypothetical protein